MVVLPVSVGNTSCIIQQGWAKRLGQYHWSDGLEETFVWDLESLLFNHFAPMV